MKPETDALRPHHDGQRAMSDHNGTEQTHLDTERNLRKLIAALQAENAELLARAEAAEKELALCYPYLKEHETPAMCIARNRTDVDKSLSMCANEMKKREALESQLSTLRESMRWIPVSERLPDNCLDVLVFREEDGNRWRDVASLDNGWFESITHWMPLPTPPQEPIKEQGE